MMGRCVDCGHAGPCYVPAGGDGSLLYMHRHKSRADGQTYHVRREAARYTVPTDQPREVP